MTRQMLKPPTLLQPTPRKIATFTGTSTQNNRMLGTKRKAISSSNMNLENERKKRMGFEAKTTNTLTRGLESVSNPKTLLRVSKKLENKARRISEKKVIPRKPIAPLRQRTAPVSKSNRPQVSGNRSKPMGSAYGQNKIPASKNSIPSANTATVKKIEPTEPTSDIDSDGGPPDMPKGSNFDFKIRANGMEKISEYWRHKYLRKRSQAANLSSDVSKSESKYDQLENKLAESNAVTKNKMAVIEDLRKQIDALNTTFQTEKQNHIDTINQINLDHKTKMALLQDEKSSIENENNLQKDKISNLSNEIDSEINLKKQLEVNLADVKKVNQELQELQNSTSIQLQTARSTIEEKSSKISEMEAAVAQLKDKISELATTLHTEENLRRKLHNTIQELKGNIRVFCRSRPLSTSETADQICLEFGQSKENANSISLIQQKENATGESVSKASEFTFDNVFHPSSSQDEVYSEVSQLIQSALDGYSVCIFAYGQTGSGKTFTMEGPDNPSKADLGVIPRALEHIYAETVRLSAKGWAYELNAQFVEIYNEQLYDLLSDMGVNSSGSGIGRVGDNLGGVASPRQLRKRPARGATNNKEEPKVEIRQAPDGGIFVSGCSKVPVDSADSVSQLLQKARDNRRVAATLCNDRSSRSHCVFSLFINGKNSATSESCQSMLNLIDLAGSERLSQSGSTGDRLKETQAINKSLSCLGDVIFALANNGKHVPYRNSKLTHLLQPSLGAGNSKTLMFVCVSPSASNSQETLCSLRFAAKVNSCHIGTAKKQA